MAFCESKVDTDEGDNQDCGLPAVAQVSAGCRHEHIDDGSVCSEHLRDLKDSQMFCVPCFSADGHICIAKLLTEQELTLTPCS